MSLKTASNTTRPHAIRLMILMAFAMVSGASAFAEDGTLDSELQIKGKRVLAAFAPVIADVRKSTVEIWCQGKVSVLGVVVDENGHILTKASELLSEPECRFSDGSRSRAKVIAVDRKYDLALLSVSHDGLIPVKWVSEDFKDVGRWVVTPGLRKSPIAVGVVGVGELEIPAHRGRGVLGVTISENGDRPTIQNVKPFSSAARSGLQTGDVILQLAEQLIDTSDNFQKTFQQYRPGDSFFLRILRGKNYMNLQVTLDRNIEHAFQRQGIQNRMGGKISLRRGGFSRTLQHDTVLAPHECGGPLVNLKGEVVGLNIARAGRTETFALPISIVKSRLEELLSGRMAVVMPTFELPETSFVSEDLLPEIPPLPEPPPLPEG